MKEEKINEFQFIGICTCAALLAILVAIGIVMVTDLIIFLQQ